MIRALVWLSVVLALVNVSEPLFAAGDPGDRFLTAFFLIQEGDAAEKAEDWTTASTKFTAALAVINEVKAQAPDWHPSLVEFRSKYCADHIASLAPKVPAVTTPLPASPPPVTTAAPVTPVVPAPVVQSESEQVAQLKAQLQQMKDDVRRLTDNRDQLASQVADLMKEPAPTDRKATKAILDQLHALQAANASVNKQLAEAQAKTAKVDELSGQLTASQQKVKELETGRDQLSVQLKSALAKVEGSQTTPQIEELVKKNSDLTAQLASAKAEITKLRDQVLAAPPTSTVAEAAEAIKLRSDLTQTRTELDQTKSLLTQRTKELTLTRSELEKVKAEKNDLAKSQDELMARLGDSDRQLRAAKAAGEKNDQIIQQLHKENDLLHQIAERRAAKAAEGKPEEESGGFLWFKRKAKAAPAPATPTNTVTAGSTSQSEANRLTASVKAPAPTDTAKASAENVRVVAEAATTDGEGASEIRILLGQAKAAIDAKDYAAAKTYLTTAESKEPRNVTVLINLGTVLYQLGQLDEAADMLRRAVTIEPNQGKSRSLLGVVYLRKGRIDDAYNELTRAVAIEPRNPEAHNYLGIVMAEKGWVAAGEQEIRRAIELRPEYADAHFNLSVIYARERTPRLELSRYHYQKAVELGAPRDPQLEIVLKQPGAVAETPKTTPSKNP